MLLGVLYGAVLCLLFITGCKKKQSNSVEYIYEHGNMATYYVGQYWRHNNLLCCTTKIEDSIGKYKIGDSVNIDSFFEVNYKPVDYSKFNAFLDSFHVCNDPGQFLDSVIIDMPQCDIKLTGVFITGVFGCVSEENLYSVTDSATRKKITYIKVK